MKKKTNPYRVTLVTKRRYDNLIVSEDWDENPKRTYPVFLYTPDIKHPDQHWHIPLKPAEVRRLYRWLGTHLSNKKKR